MACHCVKPKTIFEMGTFSGYSTYEFARREKPLHSLCSGQPLFGSEIKSLLTMSRDLREIDPYDDSLILGSTPIGDTGIHNRTSMLGRIGRPSRRSGANAPDISDVPFLSGGVDSSIVVALMSKFSSTPVQGP